MNCIRRYTLFFCSPLYTLTVERITTLFQKHPRTSCTKRLLVCQGVFFYSHIMILQNEKQQTRSILGLLGNFLTAPLRFSIGNLRSFPQIPNADFHSPPLWLTVDPNCSFTLASLWFSTGFLSDSPLVRFAVCHSPPFRFSTGPVCCFPMAPFAVSQWPSFRFPIGPFCGLPLVPCAVLYWSPLRFFIGPICCFSVVHDAGLHWSLWSAIFSFAGMADKTGKTLDQAKLQKNESDM